MGLDMYLSKMRRYKFLTPRDIENINSYFRWLEDRRDPNSTANKYTLKEWCNVDENELSKQAIDFFKPLLEMKYYVWDEEKKYGHEGIIDHVDYWRKANHIHKWFVENVQDTVDDCDSYIVTEEQLEDLLEICEIVLEHSTLVYEDEEYIVNSNIAKKLLPTSSGFFFGSEEYDQWYYRDVEYTVELLKKVLAETDFDKEMIVYSSSW